MTRRQRWNARRRAGWVLVGWIGRRQDQAWSMWREPMDIEYRSWLHAKARNSQRRDGLRITSVWRRPKRDRKEWGVWMTDRGFSAQCPVDGTFDPVTKARALEFVRTMSGIFPRSEYELRRVWR